MSPIRKRLLCVDDERGIRETLALVLLRNGFSVTLAATVQQALQQIEAQGFDLLLCDLNIERERDGYALDAAVEATRLGADDYSLLGPTHALDELLGGYTGLAPEPESHQLTPLVRKLAGQLTLPSPAGRDRRSFNDASN